MNVYRFAKDRSLFKVVIAASIGEAEQAIDFDYESVKVVYKNVDIVVPNN